MADFRKNTLVPLRQVCRECTLWCKQLDLFAGELVAIDGSTCTAVNAHFSMPVFRPSERPVGPPNSPSRMQKAVP